MKTSIAVFCGSHTSDCEEIRQGASEIGKSLARRGIRLVYGAGRVGLMGLVADAALSAGGEVLGVIPEFLMREEVCHQGLSELIVTQTMHERKRWMEQNSNGFLILPGGFGTLDEFFEILTWKQLRLHQKPIGLWNVNGFYDALLEHFRVMGRRGLVSAENLQLVEVSTDLEKLLDGLANAMGRPRTTPSDSERSMNRAV